MYYLESSNYFILTEDSPISVTLGLHEHKYTANTPRPLLLLCFIKDTNDGSRQLNIISRSRESVVEVVTQKEILTTGNGDRKTLHVLVTNMHVLIIVAAVTATLCINSCCCIWPELWHEGIAGKAEVDHWHSQMVISLLTLNRVQAGLSFSDCWFSRQLNSTCQLFQMKCCYYQAITCKILRGTTTRDTPASARPNHPHENTISLENELDIIFLFVCLFQHNKILSKRSRWASSFSKSSAVHVWIELIKLGGRQTKREIICLTRHTTKTPADKVHAVVIKRAETGHE